MIKLDPLTEIAVKARGHAEGIAVFMDLARGPKTETALPHKSKTDPRDDEIVRGIMLDPKEKEAADAIRLQLESVPEADRKRALRKLILEYERKISAVQAERKNLESRKDRYNKLLAGIEDITTGFEKSFVLEKAAESLFEKVRKSAITGHLHYFSKHTKTEYPSADYEREIFRQAEVFIIQHDWAGALSSAKDLECATFRLPYEICAFEFQFSGRRVISLASDIEGHVVFTPIFETKIGWLLLDFIYDCDGTPTIGDGHSFEWVAPIGSQIRAICISLDAEIAKTEAQREVHSGIESKNSHTPLKNIHVVSLIRKPRALNAPTGGGGGRPKRLHFRRGHWRHFATFKTWVKWCLVGNPDLGFIDKQYKL